ncbi:MAG: BMP family protein [Chloroflexi bacterium]|nr:BMP family protein [Chloroflexota bacterium]MCL5075382.1 BMP family protein [Chloroflexota bacterium]
MGRIRGPLMVSIALLAVLGLLVACGAPAAAPTPTPTVAKPTATVAAAAATPTTVPTPAKVAATPTPTAMKLKVALVTSGPINDGGWNQSAYEGLQEVKKKLGAEVANTENTKQADQEQIIRSYANRGFNVIFGHGFEYADSLKAVAKDFPKVEFVQIGGGESNGKNLSSFLFKAGEMGYLMGFIAAKMTKTNKIGEVGAMEIPTIAADFENFKIAVKKYNPKATVVTAYTGSWEDIGKAKEAALAQIATGVDVILANGDAANIGAIDAAKEKNIYAMGWTKDQTHLAPKHVLTSAIQSVEAIVLKSCTWAQEGKLGGKNYKVGIADGVSALGPMGPMIPKEIQDEAKQLEKDLAAGKIELKTEFK